MRRKRPAFFSGYAVEDGVRRRLRRDELHECWRMWSKHADIRNGNAERWGALPLGEHVEEGRR